jgi:hypothetical protein
MALEHAGQIHCCCSMAHLGDVKVAGKYHSARRVSSASSRAMLTMRCQIPEMGRRGASRRVGRARLLDDFVGSHEQ